MQERGDINDLPEWARKLIHKLRNESARNRADRNRYRKALEVLLTGGKNQ